MCADINETESIASGDERKASLRTNDLCFSLPAIVSVLTETCVRLGSTLMEVPSLVFLIWNCVCTIQPNRNVNFSLSAIIMQFFFGIEPYQFGFYFC